MTVIGIGPAADVDGKAANRSAADTSKSDRRQMDLPVSLFVILFFLLWVGIIRYAHKNISTNPNPESLEILRLFQQKQANGIKEKTSILTSAPRKQP